MEEAAGWNGGAAMTMESQMTGTRSIIKFPRWEDPPIHPANNAPLMSKSELKELAKDIEKYGLQEPIIYWRDNREAANGSEGPFQLYLLDGRNRREALRLLGVKDPRKAKLGNIVAGTTRILDAIKQVSQIGEKGIATEWVTDCDPYAFHLSLNAYRRHLTSSKKRWLIKQAIMREPTASNHKISQKIGASQNTVAIVRSEMVQNLQTETFAPPLQRAVEIIAAMPNATASQVAKKAKVSIRTAKSARKKISSKKPGRKPRAASAASEELAAWIMLNCTDRASLNKIAEWLVHADAKQVCKIIGARVK